MARTVIDKDVRRKIMDARRMVERVFKENGNEAETRRRIERIFESLLGYDVFDHLSRERAIRGAGETEHVDFAIQLEPGQDSEPVIMVELKRASVNLTLKHLKQVTSYAIDCGCEWVLLTNSREWKLYHVEFGQPPITKLIEQWDLLEDNVADLAAKFQHISYRTVKRGGLERLWEKASVLSVDSLLMAITNADSLKMLCRILKKNGGVIITPPEVVKGLQKLFNEATAIELSKIKIELPARRKKRPKENVAASETDQEVKSLSES